MRKEWLILTMVVLVGIAGAGGLWIAGKLRPEIPGVDRGDAPVSAAVVTAPEAPPEKWQGPIPAKVAENFIRAESNEERLKWVRFPDEVEEEMTTFFATGAGATEKFTNLWPLPQVVIDGVVFQEFSAEFKTAKPRLVVVTVDPSGAKVDFGAYVLMGSETWDDVIDGRAPSAQHMKVVLEPSTYYLRSFSNEDEWMSFRATSPQCPQILNFYIKRDSPQAEKLREKRGRTTRATVSIQAIGNSAEYRQFEVTDVEALGWVRPE